MANPAFQLLAQPRSKHAQKARFGRDHELIKMLLTPFPEEVLSEAVRKKGRLGLVMVEGLIEGVPDRAGSSTGESGAGAIGIELSFGLPSFRVLDPFHKMEWTILGFAVNHRACPIGNEIPTGFSGGGRGMGTEEISGLGSHRRKD